MVDLQRAKAFRSLGVELLSISPDPIEAWADAADQLGIRTPVLSDGGNRVASAYGVMRWAMPTGEPGHTFVLVDEEGRVAWIRDYGAPQHGGAMYVPPAGLIPQIRGRLG